MVRRCTKSYSSGYSRYGALGITVCERWLNFDNFLDDMGIRPDGTTIDRIDGARGYEPGNCRWADIKMQQRNIKSNVLVTFNGETLSMAEWAERLGLHRDTLDYRVRNGWGDAAFTTPAKQGNRIRTTGHRMLEHEGRLQSLSAWAREFGMSPSLLRLRIKSGMSLRDAIAKPKGIFMKANHAAP